MILPPATLAQADTPTRKPWRRDQGRPRKKNGRPTPDTPGPPPAMPGPGPPPRRPQKPPDGSTGGRICKPHRHGNGQQMATGNAMHGNGGDANATRKRRTGAGRKKNKAGCNFTRKKKLHYRAATEATRKEGRRTAAGQKNAPAGEDPRKGEKKPAGSVAHGGSELFEQGLENGPAKDERINDQHSASPPYSPRRAGCQWVDRSQIWEYLTGPRSRRKRSASGSV